MKRASLVRNAIVVLLLALMLLMALPAQQASASGSGGAVYYTVRFGDTLFSIASRYGVSYWYLARINGIPDPNRIWAGQRLLIFPSSGPVHPGIIYIVKPGDTLWGIARFYGTTPWAIAQANGIYNLNYIRIGQRLVIP